AYAQTGISAANFPKIPGEREPEPEQVAGGDGEEFIVKMLPGAGNYNTDPTTSFSKSSLTIKAGTKVTWLNTDDMVHFNKDDQGKEFETPVLKPGMRYSHIFRKPGV